MPTVDESPTPPEDLPREWTENISSPARCPWCGNDGLVVVETRPGLRLRVHRNGNDEITMITDGVDPTGGVLPYEDMGPCPYCEKGRKIEFPTSKEGSPVIGPWGVNGYWQGRDPVKILGVLPPDYHRRGSHDQNVPLPEETRALLARLRDRSDPPAVGDPAGTSESGEWQLARVASRDQHDDSGDDSPAWAT